MRVGSHAGIWVCHQLAVDFASHNGAGQVLNVDLVHDSSARRYNLEVVKSSLSPAQELVALCIALVFKLNISLGRVSGSGYIDDHRVVNNHLGRSQWVDLLWVATKCHNCLAHGR